VESRRDVARLPCAVTLGKRPALMPSHAVHPLARVRTCSATAVDGSSLRGWGGDVDHGCVVGATSTAVAESLDDTGGAPIRPTCE
jgi:hypothetical protein